MYEKNKLEVEGHSLTYVEVEGPSEEAIYRFSKKLRRMGIDDRLAELGAEEGDQVRILDFYFEYRD